MGVVAPAYFIPAANDPYLHALSRFVIARALADSRQFANANQCAHLIPLPLLALEDMQFIDGMLERLSEKARQNGFLIGVDCIDLVNDYALVQRIGAQLAQRNIGIAISDIDAEGAALAACRDLPVVEMKINRRLIRGCADRIKQVQCAEILGIARGTGAKTASRRNQTFSLSASSALT